MPPMSTPLVVASTIKDSPEHVRRYVEGNLAGGVETRALETAISENQADIEALQGVMSANPAVSAKLGENAVDVSTVVAAKVEADGSLTVFAK